MPSTTIEMADPSSPLESGSPGVCGAFYSELAEETRQSLQQAAKFLKSADYMIVFAGAGMGVDAGLGTFRGGGRMLFPPVEERKISYPHACKPARMDEDDLYGGPPFAWAFWKTCIDSYAASNPHRGYEILGEWAEKLQAKKEKDGPIEEPILRSLWSSAVALTGGSTPRVPSSTVQVCTSNVDGYFERISTFKGHVHELHGCVLRLQCQGKTRSSSSQPIVCPNATKTWPIGEEELRSMKIDPEKYHVVGSLPTCHGCNRPARPNVMMFNDAQYLTERGAESQEEICERWREGVVHAVKHYRKCCLALEIGAGKEVPTVRQKADEFCKLAGCPLVRINLHDYGKEIDHSRSGSGVDAGGDAGTSSGKYPFVGLPMSAAPALQLLDWLSFHS